jgi:PAS domain S-box-containing protein
MRNASENRQMERASVPGASPCGSDDESLPCCAILKSMTDGVFTVDLDRRIHRFFNRAAEEITGFAFAEAAGQFCFDILRSSTCQHQCPLEQSLRTGEPVYNHPAVIINRKGKEIPVSVTTALLRNRAGKITGAVEIFRDLSALEALRRTIAGGYCFGDMVSKNHRMQEIFAILPDIAASDSHLLIQGPSGSGKGLLASVVHELSSRKDGPFVKVNCGALPDTLLESELFGYVRGAFTDARKDKPGRFAVADGGTIFLDEIGDASAALQVKLLRVLEDRTFTPLGGVAPLKVDVRVIAASHRDVPALVQAGAFREDLFYRLNIVKIELPPLRERREDIPLLVEHCLGRLTAQKGKAVSGVSDGVLARLMNHAFPGNIRELENILEHAYILCRGSVLEERHLPHDFIDRTDRAAILPKISESPLDAAEGDFLRQTLAAQGGNRIDTAHRLGISRSTLWRKLRKHGLHRVR